MNPTRTKLFVLLVVCALGLFGSTACASKKYVRKQVDARVTPVEGRTGELEESSRNLTNRTTELESTTTGMKGQISDMNNHMGDLDRGVSDAKGRADSAMTAANNVNSRVDNLDVWKVDETDSVLFKVGSSKLTEEGKASLDQLVSKMKDTTGYLIEIQGFTDSTGGEELNRRLSEARARSVYDYLAEHDVPIHKMQIVGLGEAKPVAENTTRDGRKQNRRVEVRVLSNAALSKGTAASTPNPQSNPDQDKQ
ncbi:MAG TPA: OmpA family protein [Blastocatellia bacterium]|nr:OmpA family protein [Blastocatellia bacterium]